ncbi:hypothetical protein [Herbaspirillum frisingense]|uniref:hypothetical protein n=1 Tax=Herbaspirillum frisingense TaxID=92645 RepID=UPI0039B068B4
MEIEESVARAAMMHKACLKHASKIKEILAVKLVDDDYEWREAIELVDGSDDDSFELHGFFGRFVFRYHFGRATMGNSFGYVGRYSIRRIELDGSEVEFAALPFDATGNLAGADGRFPNLDELQRAGYERAKRALVGRLCQSWLAALPEFP